MLSGFITLKDGTVIEITDKDLVNNSLKITMSTCREFAFDIGSFNAGMMNISIFDDEALEHEFDGAEIRLSVVTETEEETVSTPLGIYVVDGGRTKRQRNVVKLTAQDYSSMFDVEFPEELRNSSYTAYNFVSMICERVGVVLANSNFDEFPNANEYFKPTSASIQTYRDAVMWTAQLLCANAIINRDGELELRPARYTESNGEIVIDRKSDGSDRANIQFSDVRTYVKYLTAYSGNTPKEYVSDIAPSDAQAREASLSLYKNPLLDGVSEYNQDLINEAILEYLDNYAPRKIKMQMFFDPTIQLGDTMRCSGGKVDVRRSIVGVVTSISAVYRGMMTVVCAAPQAVKKAV